MGECIFCNIVNKQADADIIYEDEHFVAFHDINPKASFHILIVPKKHIQSFREGVDGGHDTYCAKDRKRETINRLQTSNQCRKRGRTNSRSCTPSFISE